MPSKLKLDAQCMRELADKSAADSSIFNEPSRYELRGIDRDRKANSLRRPDHRGINADDFTVRRDQRPPRIAGVQGSIRLDHIVDQPAGL